MHISDIRHQIYLQIRDDTKQLLAACSTDRLSRNICSDPRYWYRKFEEYQLPIPTIRYSNPNGWIFELETQRLIQLYVNNLLSDDSDLYKEGGLIIYANTVPLVEVLNVQGVNIEEVSLIHNRNLLDKFTANITGLERTAGLTFAALYYDEPDSYIVDISYQPFQSLTAGATGHIYYVTLESMRQILYNSLSRGFIPQEGMNGDHTKLIT